MGIKLTKFTSNSGLLTKVYKQDSSGEIRQIASAPTLSDGVFETLSITCLDDLKRIIEGLSHNEALCYSISPIGKGTIVLKGKEDTPNGIISRSKDYFDYPVGLGILMIDIDDEEMDETEVVRRLGDLFDSVSYLYADSASAGINGKKGFHLYFIVDDLSIVEEAMNNLFRSSFNNGWGYYKVSSSGALLERAFFDKAVYNRGRLDFISGAKLLGDIQQHRNIRVVHKEKPTVDLLPLLVTVDAEEARQKAKALVSPELGQVRDELYNKDSSGISREDFDARYDGNIAPSVPLLKDQLCEDFLITSSTYFLLSLESPLSEWDMEDPFYGEPGKTKLYLNENTGVPKIHTFAKGGAVYTLKHTEESFQTLMEYVEGYDIPKHLIDRLRISHELPIVNKNITLMPIHKDTIVVYNMMKESFIHEYKNPRILVEQWAHMASLYLHLLDGNRGRYAVTLNVGSGKTQVILHLALFLYKQGRTNSLAVSFEKVDAIEEAFEWLMERMKKLWREDPSLGEPENYVRRIHSKVNKDELGKLDTAPVVFHTHYRVRDNEYLGKYFRYNGRERDLLIYDETLEASLYSSLYNDQVAAHLSALIDGFNSGSFAIPPDIVAWVSLFKAKVISGCKAMNTIADIKSLHIEMSLLDDKAVRYAYSLFDNEERSSFFATLFQVGSSDNRLFVLTKEVRGIVLFFMKENDSNLVSSLVSTDASRGARGIYEHTKFTLDIYPIPEWELDQTSLIEVFPLLKTGNEHIQNVYGELDEGKEGEYKENSIYNTIINKWLNKVNPKKVLLCCSKGINPKHYIQHPDVRVIHWGSHDSTNEHRDCDAIISLNLFHKPMHVYKALINEERGRWDIVSSDELLAAECGDIAMTLQQLMGRGTRRNGKASRMLCFLPDDQNKTPKILEYLDEAFPLDLIDFYEDPESLVMYPEYVTEQERSMNLNLVTDQPLRKEHPDKKYANDKEKEKANQFKRACRGSSVPYDDNLVDAFMRDWREDQNIKPLKWLNSYTKIAN